MGVSNVRVKQEPGLQIVPEQPLPELPSLPHQERQVPTELKRPPDDEEQGPPAKKTAMESIFGEIFITKVEQAPAKAELIEKEVLQYKSEPALPLDADPLQWWRENRFRFQHLARLAQMYLAIPGTSVPSERVFSVAGDICTAQRASLTRENMDMLIFLKKNMKI